jgi:NADH dehydrogenase FAD-containing subunit
VTTAFTSVYSTGDLFAAFERQSKGGGRWGEIELTTDDDADYYVLFNQPGAHHKGNMAVVGKNYAVLERGWLRTSGFLTWLVWAFIHILSLPQLQNRLRVQHQWVWSYFTGQRSSRLIPEPPLTPGTEAR